MSFAALVELAAGAATASALPIDLHAPDPCDNAGTAEIVVCGAKNTRNRYRLPKLSQTYGPKPLHPENIIPGGRIHVQSETRPDGLIDKKIMISFGLLKF